MTPPLISAMMPTYNTAQYLVDSIESVIQQTYTHWELLLVDDGSTDNTSEIVGQFADERIRYRYIPHSGRGVARNVALEMAAGKYLAITDSDDINLPHRFQQQVDFLENHPDIAVVGGQLKHFVDTQAPVDLAQYPLTEEQIKRKFSKRVMGVAHPTAMLRMDVVRSLGGYCDQCLRAQDLELFLRISHRHRMLNLPQVLILYRNDPRQTTLKFWTELHLFQEYAGYRYDCYVKSVRPMNFTEWKHKPSVWMKMLTWHTLRFVKSSITARIKWKTNVLAG